MAKAALQDISVTDMVKEIERRKKQAHKLKTKRERLVKQINALDKEIAALGKDAGSKTSATSARKRPRNKVTLPAAMASVMSKTKPMSVNQIAEGVLKGGYKSTSKTFKTIIFQTLGKNKAFKKKTRGQYILR